MATTIFLSVCAAAASFMLYCLYHFGEEQRRGPGSSSQDDSWIATSKLTVAPVQLGGPASIAIWSERAWHYIVSSVPESQAGSSKENSARKGRYDVAA